MRNSKGKQVDSEEEDGTNEDLEFIEALLAKRVSKGKGKFRGEITLICFSCEEVGHITTRCPNKEDKDKKRNNRFKGKKEFKKYKDYKDKGKKSCYIAKDYDSDDNEEVVVYIAIKDESNKEENENMALISHVSKNNTWFIDTIFSHHMTGDKTNFEHLEHYDSGSVRFGNSEPYYVKGKWFITITQGIKCGNAYWVEGLRHNLLSVAQLKNIGYKVEFMNGKLSY